MLTLLAVLLNVSLSRLDDLNDRIKNTGQEQITKNQLITTMHKGVLLRKISMRNMLLTPDFIDRDEESLRFYSYATPILVSRNELAAMNLSADERKLVDNIVALMKVAYPIQNDLVDEALSSEKMTGLNEKLKIAIVSQNAVTEEIKRLAKVHVQQARNTIQDTENTLQDAHNLVNTLGISLFLLGGLIAFVVIKIVRNQEIVIDGTVDELHNANDQLETANEELELKVEERTHDLSIARDSALNLNRIKSQFVANMSHELRTPLNAIIGYTEMLQEEVSSLDLPGVSEDLDNVHTASRQLIGLIDQVLDLSKVESGKLEISPTKLELSPFLDKVYRIALPSVTTNGNRLSTNYPDDIGEMNVDSMRLRQILLNLLNNAGKFTSNGDVSLTVSRQTRQGADWMIFNVKDTGIGIDPALFRNIFQQFTQADISTTRHYGGTGLGLAICQQLCILMGGYISVESSPGQGATFTVSLPLNNDQSKIAIAS